jgi:hypothetical protein
MIHVPSFFIHVSAPVTRAPVRFGRWIGLQFPYQAPVIDKIQLETWRQLAYKPQIQYGLLTTYELGWNYIYICMLYVYTLEMCTKNNLSFSPGSVFTLYIQIMCVYIIYNVCVCLAYETSFVSKYLKPTPKTKAGRLPLRRHHEAAVEGNHSLASPPAAGNPWRIPWRNPGFPHGKNHPRLENRKRKSRVVSRLELQLPTVRQVPQQRAAADKKGPSLLGYRKSHRKLWIEITSYS